jgi:cation diffusion facilitator CzcD-associated flavoprotein CzcO
LIQDEIAFLRETALVTRSGKEYACDILILAHGFESETFKFPLKGRDGTTPEDHWAVAGGPSCYKGIAMHDFPNFFMIRGPNMASG